MADKYHLSFSIGPVQTFVAQARRTRDLWAGSWLLSYLAESALAAAENASGKSIIPARSASERGNMIAKQSAVGGMPNRFELEFHGDNAKQRAIDAAKAAHQAFQDAWNRIAQAVFDAFLTTEVRQLGNGTEEIWRRQVDRFWELSWVVGQLESGEHSIGRLAAMRKTFRNVPATEEPGVKCSLMPAWQELSGHLERRAQRNFWAALARKAKGLNLGESERLCAVALIKRLFPRVMSQAVGEDIGDDLQQVHWPSTAFMAAIPWLKGLQGQALEQAKSYQQQALDANYQRTESQAARDAGIDWAGADGPIWFAGAVRNDEPGSATLGPDPTEQQRQQRKTLVADLLDNLKRVYLHAADPQTGIAKQPVPYYALLLMDGDSLGLLLAEVGNPETVSQCLRAFSAQVQKTVDDYDGRAIYAGGDDVLAMLPANSALKCAARLHAAYAGAFDDEDVPPGVATISAAVVYAHWRYPLRQVLRTAKQLLGETAKNRTGRDSIAIGVILGSGLNAVWSVPWDVFHGTARTVDNAPCSSLEQLLDRFEASEVADSPNPPFNASFLYLLRERFTYLLGEGQQKPGEFLRFAASGDDTSSDTADLLRDLAHAEYRRRMKKSVRAATPEDQTRTCIDHLMSLSRQWRRHQTGGSTSRKTEITCDRNAFSFDGWRVARFLKQIKDGKGPDHD